FEVLDAVAEQRLLEEVTVGILLDAAAQPGGVIGRAFATALATVADQMFKQVMGEAIRKRDLVRKWIDETGSIDDAIAGLCGTFGIAIDDTIERVDSETTEGPHLPSSRWAGLATVLARGSKNERDYAERLIVAGKSTGEERAERYSSIFLTDKGEPRKAIVTKTLATEHASLARDLELERERVVTLRE